MRDSKGNATRAFADITLHEVSDYQVESGIDLASRATYSTRPPAQTQDDQVAQDKPVVNAALDAAKKAFADWQKENPDASDSQKRKAAADIAVQMQKKYGQPEGGN